MLSVGLNYKGKLSGSTEDATEFKKSLSLLFHCTESKCLIDTSHTSITKQNLIEALEWLTTGAERGDVLILTYSGLSNTLDFDSTSPQSFFMVDSDGKGIESTEFLNLFVHPLPIGVTFFLSFMIRDLMD